MKKLVLIVFLLGLMPAMAREVYLNKNLNSFFTPASGRVANAICFMYEGNHYKCVCRFSDNSKIWVSKPLKDFQGELGTFDDKYGNIEGCRN